LHSVASLSINSPHTGIQDYDPNVTRIPVASITIEDAEMLARMQARGIMPVVHLYIRRNGVSNTSIDLPVQRFNEEEAWKSKAMKK
jgi:carboxypeptidase Q